FTVRTIVIFLLLFIYQTCISHSVSSCLSCSAGTIVGAVMSIVASCLIQIFNSSCSTVSYMNALKPRSVFCMYLCGNTEMASFDSDEDTVFKGLLKTRNIQGRLSIPLVIT
uniref:Uncharacterized protein n=1 Tax=Zosterops lateralis melanops TaxID=1220523 RepID=A0A8D2QQ59_ZOSLA